MSSHHAVVFCDFDGTITLNETLRASFLHFLPELAAPTLAALDAKQITLRDALVELVAALPVGCEAEMIAFMRDEPLRPGLLELLEYLAQEQIPFVVLSSGFSFYIEAMLTPFRHLIFAVHALDPVSVGSHMRLELNHDHPREAMPKAWVMREYSADSRIVIGDSMSDFEMAAEADVVFARDRLLTEMRTRQIAATPYETFYDVRTSLIAGELANATYI